MFAPEHIFFIVITFGHLLFSDMKSKIVDGGKVEVRLPFEIEDGRLAEEYNVFILIQMEKMKKLNLFILMVQ